MSFFKFDILFTKTIEKSEWDKLSLAKINKASGQLGGKNISNMYWKYLTSYNSFDTLNFIEKSKNFYAQLVYSISQSTLLATCTVERILNSTYTDMKKSIRNDVKIEAFERDIFYTINIVHENDSIIAALDLDMFEKNDDESLAKMILKYNNFDHKSIFFMSGPPEMYRALANDIKYGNMYTLECFASPFDHILNYFCSLYEDDKTLHYSNSVCMGNFFNHMKDLDQTPTRFIFNPPYTSNIIRESISELISHLEKQPLSQFIALLPNYSGMENESINNLINLEGSSHAIMKENEYYMYNYLDKKIRPGNISLILIVNYRDKSISDSMLDFCTRFMIHTEY